LPAILRTELPNCPLAPVTNILIKKSDAKGNKTVLAFEYEWDRWLTPKRYYESDYPGEKIFLLIQNKQYDYTPDLKIFKSGKQVFHDDNYTIFEYESHQAFKEGF